MKEKIKDWLVKEGFLERNSYPLSIESIEKLCSELNVNVSNNKSFLEELIERHTGCGALDVISIKASSLSATILNVIFINRESSIHFSPLKYSLQQAVDDICELKNKLHGGDNSITLCPSQHEIEIKFK